MLRSASCADSPGSGLTPMPFLFHTPLVRVRRAASRCSVRAFAATLWCGFRGAASDAHGQSRASAWSVTPFNSNCCLSEFPRVGQKLWIAVAWGSVSGISCATFQAEGFQVDVQPKDQRGVVPRSPRPFPSRGDCHRRHRMEHNSPSRGRLSVELRMPDEPDRTVISAIGNGQG